MTQDTGTTGKIGATLAERGSRYGPWREQSRVTQNIKEVFADTPNWLKLPPYLRESLDQISNKIARILSGDYMYNDNLHDIVGYASLAEECLNQDIAAGEVGPEVIDPWNAPTAYLIEQLAERGFQVFKEEDGQAVLVDPSKVRDPAYLRDPLRAFLAERGQSSDQE